MGKRRNTAKTGDKAVSGKGKKQTLERKNARDDDDDDPMYTKVDRYHNQKEEEFMKLDYVQSDSEEEEEKEAVMDLGLGGDDDTDGSSDEPSDDDDSDLQDGEKEESDLSSDDDAEVSVSSSDEEEEEEEMQDVRNWGRNKKAYYHGDTADLEIGQEIDDAYLEEEAAKEVQRARYEEMSDDDFELSDSEEQNEEKKQSGDIEKLSSSRDVNKLPTKERKKLLDKQHPEILPLISYFSGALKEFDEKTNPAAKALFEGEKDAADVSIALA
ncbi:hypothetical protein FisN_11Lh208 [Fistulifera solaris]|uniref:Uncharacterized protein n=1 Tax=Fistulifera solaris TaxID=1519565 RepID=A0A1Z5J745_FISSO|nr:hypothetical protein FisN_11Lh208 [Fistulifera solaris]|eukprot:GAX09817.1 hypothetical protein FisN_11Lh208 [Fistulifera solaris]